MVTLSSEMSCKDRVGSFVETLEWKTLERKECVHWQLSQQWMLLTVAFCRLGLCTSLWHC